MFLPLVSIRLDVQLLPFSAILDEYFQHVLSQVACAVFPIGITTNNNN
jgi:hypothetical protein